MSFQFLSEMINNTISVCKKKLHPEIFNVFAINCKILKYFTKL